MSYVATAVQGLDACPFCKEMYPRGEHEMCPHCGVKLVAFTQLPASAHADLDDDDDDERVPLAPDEQPLGWAHLGHMRGPLALVALAGLVAFTLPWVESFVPDRAVYTGVEIARRTGLAWSAGVAWFVMLPVVLSRRSIRHMRGARLATCVLGAIPGIVTTILLANPPRGAQAHGITIRMVYTWSPAIYATLALSVVAVALGLFFGGRGEAPQAGSERHEGLCPARRGGAADPGRRPRAGRWGCVGKLRIVVPERRRG